MLGPGEGSGFLGCVVLQMEGASCYITAPAVSAGAVAPGMGCFFSGFLSGVLL